MANNNTMYRPEFWASEAVELMYENFLLGGLVHRDFSNEIATMGDTVNTRQPTAFVADRKQNDLDTVNTQDAASTNIQVVLNQRAYVSFLLGDGDQSLSFQDLVNIYLVEALQAQVRLIDRCIAGHAAAFLGNSVGTLDGLSSSNTYNRVIDLRKDFNDRNVGQEGRNLVLGNNSESLALQDDRMISNDYAGEGGRAVRDAYLGRIGGFQTFRSPNIPHATAVATETATTTTAISAVGATVVNVTAVTNISAGDYLVIAGDNQPNRVLSIATLALTMSRGMTGTVASGAAVHAISSAVVDQASAIAAGDDTAAVATGYPTNWKDWIVYDGGVTPQVGQIVAFDAAGTIQTPEYVVVQADATRIMLDRPLETTFLDNAVINLGPQGECNFGFNRKALTLVSRPLRLPREGIGVRSAIAQAHGFAIRVTMSYDAAQEAERVTIGSLFGIKVLDTDRGGILLG